jgi:hypothetical protein
MYSSTILKVTGYDQKDLLPKQIKMEAIDISHAHKHPP